MSLLFALLRLGYNSVSCLVCGLDPMHGLKVGDKIKGIVDGIEVIRRLFRLWIVQLDRSW